MEILDACHANTRQPCFDMTNSPRVWVHGPMCSPPLLR